MKITVKTFALLAALTLPSISQATECSYQNAGATRQDISTSNDVYLNCNGMPVLGTATTIRTYTCVATATLGAGWVLTDYQVVYGSAWDSCSIG